jgi:hypothetical protein
MSEAQLVRWIDLVDQIYTLCLLGGVDIEKDSITGIAIYNEGMTIWYTDSLGAPRHISKKYEL